MTVASRLAEFVLGLHLENVPGHVRDKAERAVFYGLGIGYCGLGTGFARTAARAVASSGTGKATVLYDGGKAPVAAALLANSVLLHGRCQEDTCGTAHFGVAVIPALLALCEQGRGSEAQFTVSMIAGYEIGGLLEKTFARATLSSGFRASPLYSAVATAAAASRMLGLTVPQVASALAHAAAFSGGTLQALSEGTDEWRYQVGLAGQAGLAAVDLALAGSRGADLAFEGRNGFARAFAQREFDAAILDRLGFDWAMDRVTFKSYPVCAHNQSPVAAALDLHATVRSRDITDVEIRVDPYVVPGMDEVGPFTRVAETLMSTRFCVAAGLAYGQLDMSQLEAFCDPQIAELVAKCRLVTDPEIAFPGCRLTVQFADGDMIVKDLPLTTTAYDLGWETIRSQLVTIANSNALPAAPLADLEAFSRGQAGAGALSVVQAFAEARAGERQRRSQI